ncbi:hypothetical protein SPRG_11664 [Saprolegnia parasitica CBS 223.65]|uniref:CBF1-interacting co-repressor CIR N-terminal domain-containing protein n=1 Tax=Saprolegnia parasitica (strain CBS 223.65) TaxID=695850 RepID=A0A067C9Y7_SAPPC|nr:hypothetical protein SPRG_11664 [Saprolegnia parasitica CBS 223.65]KDO23351.1 hypothetical protein SPRG_11664 [Saprolegnia parasitica CBS 223.65]|eukprot:XP_012206000.1 hypothetical protein SPRG_11664 [Saprolegnia parasitica CBS 223.65]
MGGGMKFLNLKGWHPSNKTNQKRIWIAEQKAQAKVDAEKDAANEIKKDAELLRFQQIAASKGDTDAHKRIDSQKVSFMYQPPPGLQKINERVDVGEADDAVLAFRSKIEKKAAAKDASKSQRNLERYVGRRPNEAISIKDQVERFPMLKDAPVEGEYTSNIRVNFQPVGVKLRNVKCIRCGEWGHQSGDRECSLREFNPLDAARQAMEDPMQLIQKMNASRKNDLVMKSLPLEMRTELSGEFEILASDDDDDAADPERAYLASLSSKEKKKLLKKLKEETGESSKKRKHHKSEKKAKKESKRHKHSD